MSWMTIPGPGARPGPVRRAASRLEFRGPGVPPGGGHVAVLGGSESWSGRDGAPPWTERLERRLGVPCVNRAQPCGSLDLMLREARVLAAADGAAARIVVLTGAANLSNRLYSVHPRRNDRVLRTSPSLAVLFPDVDLVEVCFTRHLLTTLQAASPERFGLVREELQIAWAARMGRLMDRLAEPAWLLWLAEGPPPRAGDEGEGLGPEPLFVTREMVEALRGRSAGLVEAWGEGREARAAEMLADLLRPRCASGALREAG